MHGALPTNDLCFRRALAHNAGCQRCSASREDILHVLRDCPHSRELWYRSGLRPSRAFFAQQSAEVWLKEHARGNRECLFLAAIWWIWCWRNNMVLGDASWDVHHVLKQVINSAHDYNQYLNPRHALDVSGMPQVRWRSHKQKC